MVIEKVNSDRIDILVDLAGHTNLNRLTVFAHKPAPNQISWLGYPNTTGLESMDFRFVDQYTSGEHGNLCGTEVLLRLASGFACFRPPKHLPAVQSAPLLKNGFVTLGSLHKLEKLNEGVIKLWAGILQENPDARLLLARDQLDNWQQRRIRSLFSQHDIAGDRLELIRLHGSKHSFFDLFADIDIMLDSFPWSGHTLACCALWMGVPVVSLCGNSHAGRMVSSVLNLLKLDELVAQDDDSYRRIVGELCNNPAQLIRYRSELRTQFEESPLRDEKAFTKCLEAEYHRILN